MDAHSTEDKYRAECDKRRAATTFHRRVDVYRDESLASLATDPWVNHDEVAKQPALLAEGSMVKFLVIGAGHAGLVYSAQLVQAGFSAQDIVLVDTAGGVGGTWYWNRYPGLCCDVEGYCYLPLLEETGFIPTQRYTRGEEIRQNAEIIADKFSLRGMFCTKFIGACWDEQKGRWAVTLQRQLGAKYEELNAPFTVYVQFLIATPGPVPNPSVPALPGLSDFLKEKAVWHTARWNYDYTGGSQDDPDMVNLKDKVVGIIGTGATAVQAVPELAKWARHVYVFQRTPVYCGPHVQSKTTPKTWAKVANGPGWQYKRMENLDKFYSDDPDARSEDNWVNDGRTHHPAVAAAFGSRRAKELLRLQDEGADRHTVIQEHIERLLSLERPGAERIREHIAHTVRDPATASSLTPWYPMWCKRPAYHASYLEAFNLSNVTLVDTDGQGVQSFTRTGVIVGGTGTGISIGNGSEAAGAAQREYQLDALVFATGYMVEGLGAAGIKSAEDQKTQTGAPAVVQGYRGRGGRQFSEKWASPEFGTVLGQATHGFPNLFFQTMSNVGISGNSTPAYVNGGRFVAHILKTATAQARGKVRMGTEDNDDNEEHSEHRLVIEATQEAENCWTDAVEKGADWFAGLGICTPTWFTGYQRLDNKTPTEQLAFRKRGLWPAGPLDYADIINKYIQEESLEGFAIRT
ncbi:hypothetical protein PG993_014226 [Apiospora rasikravindrae]|uniref:Uncharacterized protein n=1 Tax=Apiospora rasikravindrae TaxID=990691 RepID=A0ABR1RTZ4_9PEZI